MMPFYISRAKSIDDLVYAIHLQIKWRKRCEVLCPRHTNRHNFFVKLRNNFQT